MTTQNQIQDLDAFLASCETTDPKLAALLPSKLPSEPYQINVVGLPLMSGLDAMHLLLSLEQTTAKWVVQRPVPIFAPSWDLLRSQKSDKLKVNRTGKKLSLSHCWKWPKAEGSQLQSSVLLVRPQDNLVL